MDKHVNVPLLRKAVEWAEAEAALEDGHWDQHRWMHDIDKDLSRRAGPDRNRTIRTLKRRRIATCGTTYCIAGYVAQLVDPRFASRISFWDDELGDSRTVSKVAIEALGIRAYQAATLFAADNDIHDVKRIADDIIEGRL